MLTGYQCEVIAFIDNGSIICRDCAKGRHGEIRVTSTERGLNTYGDFSALIRYSIDELNSERVYEAAQDLADERGIDQDDYRAIDDIVESLGDSYNEHCEDCGELLQ